MLFRSLLGDLHQHSPRDSVEYGKCEQDFLNALGCEPNNGIAHAQIGHLYLQTKRYMEAKKHLEAASLLLNSPSTVLADLYEVGRSTTNAAQATQLKALWQQRLTAEREALLLGKRLLAEPENMGLKRRYQEVVSQLGQEVSLPVATPVIESNPTTLLQSKVIQ